MLEPRLAMVEQCPFDTLRQISLHMRGVVGCGVGLIGIGDQAPADLVALGRGERPDTAAHGKLAEGVFTAPVLLEMARKKNVEMPISGAVAAVIAGKISVDEAIESLLTRPLKSEA